MSWRFGGNLRDRAKRDNVVAWPSMHGWVLGLAFQVLEVGP
jgi:hypothetical protein